MNKLEANHFLEFRMETTIMGRSKEWFYTAEKDEVLQTVRNIRLKSLKHVRDIKRMLNNNASRGKVLMKLAKSAKWQSDREWFDQACTENGDKN